MEGEFSLCYNITSPEILGTLTIDEVIDVIQNHPKADNVAKIRSMVRKSKEYDALKHTFFCIKPAGIFHEYGIKKNFMKFSGYIYYDIDDASFDFNSFLEEYGHKIFMAGKSIGGKGYFFFAKCSVSPTSDTYNNYWQLIKDEHFRNINIDEDAKSVIRNFIVSYDKDLFVNRNCEVLSIDENKIKEIEKIRKCSVRYITKREYSDIHLTEHFHNKRNKSIELVEHFWEQIIYRTKVIVNDPIVEVKPEFIVQIHLRQMPDGTKHKRFPSIVWAFMYLNPHLSNLETIKKFMHWINRNYTSSSPMDNKELERLVDFAFVNYDEEKVIGKVRKIHFNKNCGMTPNQKIRKAAQITGEVKVKKTIEKIRAAINKLPDNKKENIKQIAKLSGVSRTTITKHWDKINNNVERVEVKSEENNFVSKEKDITTMHPSTEKYIQRRKEREAKQNQIVQTIEQASIESEQISDVNIQTEIIGARIDANALMNVPKEKLDFDTAEQLLELSNEYITGWARKNKFEVDFNDDTEYLFAALHFIDDIRKKAKKKIKMHVVKDEVAVVEEDDKWGYKMHPIEIQETLFVELEKVECSDEHRAMLRKGCGF